MERLRRTVVQLEEAERFILDGEVARLRLAVILVDNAVEVMLHRSVSEDLDRASSYARMLQRFPDGPLDAKGDALRQEIAAQTIPQARQKKVGRSFGGKLTLLSEQGELPAATARALRHLHDYRNELQHHDHVRPESIRPAALILFDIAVDLVVTLVPSSMSFGSDDNIDWLRDYGMEPVPFGREDLREVIAAQLRHGLRSRGEALDITEVAQRSGLPASTLRFYEEKRLITSIGRRGLRRLFDPGVLERLALIALGRAAGFSLDEIALMFAPHGRPRLDRQMLADKANELERTIRKLSGLRDGLRHAAACPAPSHMECPRFRRILRVAASGGIEAPEHSFRSSNGGAHAPVVGNPDPARSSKRRRSVGRRARGRDEA